MKAHLLPLLPLTLHCLSPAVCWSITSSLIGCMIWLQQLSVYKRKTQSRLHKSSNLSFFSFYREFIFNKESKKSKRSFATVWGYIWGFLQHFSCAKVAFLFLVCALKHPLRAFVLFFIFSPFSFSFLHISVASTRFCRVKFLFSHLQRCFLFLIH